MSYHKEETMSRLAVAVLLVVAVTTLCYRHKLCRDSVFDKDQQDADTFERAVELMGFAESSTSPVDSLVLGTRALQMVTCVHERIGTERLTDLLQKDSMTVIRRIRGHQSAIMESARALEN